MAWPYYQRDWEAVLPYREARELPLAPALAGGSEGEN
jgi:hypothetical protein